VKVIVSPAARDYIKSEIAYLKLRSPRAALQLSEDLKRLKRDLAQFSQMGHFTEELPIPGIRHGRERPPTIALDDDFDFEQS